MTPFELLEVYKRGTLNDFRIGPQIIYKLYFIFSIRLLQIFAIKQLLCTIISLWYIYKLCAGVELWIMKIIVTDTMQTKVWIILK